MKKRLYIFVAVLLLGFGLKAGNPEKARAWMEQAKKSLFTNPKQASYYATQVIDLFPKNSSDELRVEAMIMYSQAEQLLGNFDLSIKNLYDAQTLVNPADKRMNAQLYALMGRVYSKLGDHNKAIELNDKATSIYKSLADSLAIAQCYNERGVTHYLMNEFQVAERFLRQALLMNRAQRNLKGVAANLNNLCLYEGDTQEKLTLIREAIVINKHLESQWSLGENYNNMGKQHFFAKQYPQALEALKQAYGYAAGIGARELICDNYEYSSWVYAAIGDYAQAYQCLEKMSMLSKELQSNNKLRNIEQEISYKKYQDQMHATEMKERGYEIELLKRNVCLLSSVIILGVVAGIFLYKWYKRRKDLELVEARYRLEQSEHELSVLKVHQQELKLQNVQNALESSRQELTSFAVFLQSRNELLNKIRDMIKEGYKMDEQNLVPHLKKINAFICQYQSGDKTNTALLLNIDEKSKEFADRLMKRHPDLTQGERYLATLLRVNLSTKEIAMITGSNPKSVNMNRYRLRKSLGLSTEEDLTVYLQGV